MHLGGPPHQVVVEVEKVLAESFGPDELRRFVRGLPGGSEVLGSVPDQQAPSTFCGEVVGALARRGLLDERFFDALERERPKLASVVRRIRGLLPSLDDRGPGDLPADPGLEPLLDVLKARVRGVGVDREEAAARLRDFKTDVGSAIQATLGLDERPSPDRWGLVIEAAGYRIDPRATTSLAAENGSTSLATYELPNVERALLSSYQALRGTRFSSELYARQRLSEALTRAQRIIDACESAFPTKSEDVHNAVLIVAQTVLSSSEQARMRALDARDQVRYMIRSLGARGGGIDVHLRHVAHQLRLALPPGTSFLPELPSPQGASSQRLVPTLAVWLTPMPRGSGHRFEIRNVALVHPAVPDLDRKVLPRPVPVRSEKHLMSALRPVIHKVEEEVRKSGRTVTPWNQVVLQLMVDPVDAGRPFEDAEWAPGLPASQFFRCVTARPSRGIRGGSAPRVDRPVANPTDQSSSVRLDDEVLVGAATGLVRYRRASFLGSWAAKKDKRILRGVRSFEAHPLSVVSHRVPLDTMITRIFGEEGEVDIGTVFDRVSQLRTGERVTILWDDPDYDIGFPMATE